MSYSISTTATTATILHGVAVAHARMGERSSKRICFLLQYSHFTFTLASLVFFPGLLYLPSVMVVIMSRYHMVS